MSSTIEYNGYHGSVEFSQKNMIFHGKILFINELITFEGKSVNELVKSFCYAVKHYMEESKRTGNKPDKRFKGSFNVRIGEKLHHDAALYAETHGYKSINALIKQALEEKIVK